VTPKTFSIMTVPVKILGNERFISGSLLMAPIGSLKRPVGAHETPTAGKHAAG
jgi:hypothetical protein